jgi:hypothetical protein
MPKLLMTVVRSRDVVCHEMITYLSTCAMLQAAVYFATMQRGWSVTGADC